MTEVENLEKQLKKGQTHSLWIDTTERTNFPALQPDLSVDTIIIGGGIAGLTTAVLLQEAGQKVAVIEARRIVEDTTGHTTAKITALHGFIYQQIRRLHGKAESRLFAEANQGALELIKQLVEEKNIDCNFQRSSAYSYTESEQNLTLIEDEVAACKNAGLKTYYTEDTPLPFKVAGAVCLENQAQFHPRKYLLALADEINRNGNYIFERTRAIDVQEQEKSIVETDRGEIRAENVVLASHFPFYDKGFFYARLYPYRAYALGLRIEGEVPGGMYYSQDGPHHSIRNYIDDNGPVLIVGGGYHRSGQVINTLNNYKDVLRYAAKRFNIQSVNYYWSTMDYRTMDSLPYIGKSPHTKNVYIAAGFGAWGMTNGTLAATIISDQILGRKNKYIELFNPSRINLAKSAGKLASQNISVMKTYLKGLLFAKKPDLSKLPAGEAKVLKVGGKKIAAYKDEQGQLHTISAVCNHMGCLVNWNNAERSWDCPCHGSRFAYDGKVIHGPAVQDLPKKTLS